MIDSDRSSCPSRRASHTRFAMASPSCSRKKRAGWNPRNTSQLASESRQEKKRPRRRRASAGAARVTCRASIPLFFAEMFTVLIPARYASTRLPGKPLLDIAGKPMVVRVAERARASGAARVVVATDDERIRAVVADHGIDVLMTRSTHPTGTDRLAEAAAQLGLDDKAIVVNVQGDEPLLEPELIHTVADTLTAHADASIRRRHSTPTWSRWCLTATVTRCTSAGRRFRGRATVSPRFRKKFLSACPCIATMASTPTA